jgi:hypothetical protein
MCFEGVVAGATIVFGGDIVEVVVAVVIDSVEVIAGVVVITDVEPSAPVSVVGVATDGDSVVVGDTVGVGGVVNAGVARVFESLWDVDFPSGLKRRFTAMASSSVNVVSSFLMRFPVTGQVQRANTT